MVIMFGMVLGGWMFGKIFDFIGSYYVVFVNGIVWNLLNLGIVVLFFIWVCGMWLWVV